MSETVTVAAARAGVHGSITVPGDKSIAHRALLLAAVAEGTSRVRGFPGGADNRATLDACRRLGVRIEERGDEVSVEGRGWDGLRAPTDTIDCANSGTSMRLLAGVLAARPFRSRLDGDASLRRRPMARVIAPLTQMGAAIRSEGGDDRAPLVIDGATLRALTHVLPVASAQVKSALILAGLQTAGETRIEEPARSRDHTERMLRVFGGRIAVDGRRLVVPGPQTLRAATIDLPGDFSSAAFPLVAALVVPGSEVSVRGVGLNPSRTGLLDALRAMGAELEVEATGDAAAGEPSGTIRARSQTLRGARIGGELLLRAIDEFPILCLAAACATGRTEFTDAAELRVKESDRIAAMVTLLRQLGAAVEERPAGLVVHGGAPLQGGRIDALGDHRVAMTAAIAGLVSRDGVTIDGAACAAVSYPGFYEMVAGLAATPGGS
jgi:3-phosphoshikimate 1-carboxyvinyltransferase